LQHRKILAALLAIFIVAIAIPVSIPRGHADHSSEQLTTSGYVVRSYYDTYLGRTVDAVKAGSVLSFTLVFVANSVIYQRNVSMGVKFDWMNSYQNSSMANPQNTYTIFANQIVYLTLNFTVPELTGQYSGLNLVSHSWTLQVWDGPANTAWTFGCFFDNGVFQPGNACHQFNNGSPIAIYSSAQASGVQDSQQASAVISALKSSLGGVIQTPPGATNAIALMAQANALLTAGNNAYQTGDFATAQSDYHNALNDANAAQGSLATTGGGTDTATLTSIWLEAVAMLLAGIGAILVGFAGFKYLRTRARAYTGYTPASAPKA
jgi:hypothetical protein